VFPAIFMPKLDLGSLSLYSRRGVCFILVNVIWRVAGGVVAGVCGGLGGVLPKERAVRWHNQDPQSAGAFAWPSVGYGRMLYCIIRYFK